MQPLTNVNRSQQIQDGDLQLLLIIRAQFYNGDISMSSLFVNNIKHTNTQDAISIDTSGNVILDKVGTGAFYRTGTFTPYYSSHAATTPNVSDVFTLLLISDKAVDMLE